MNAEELKAGEELATKVQAAKADFLRPVQSLAGLYFRCQQHCYERYVTLEEAEDCKLRCKGVMSRFNHTLDTNLAKVFTGFFKCVQTCREQGGSCLQNCQEEAALTLQESKQVILTAADKTAKQYA